MKNRIILFSIFALVTCALISYAQGAAKNPYYSHTDNTPLKVTDAQWKKILSAETYHIMREQGTEAAGTGPYSHTYDKGTYYCAACGHPLFSSKTKFDSGTGWPSFYEPLNAQSVKETKDNSDGMTRNEIHCARCGGHLGHVFDDGPKPTGLRYCMDGYALKLEAGK